jgi:hypothetical protein
LPDKYQKTFLCPQRPKFSFGRPLPASNSRASIFMLGSASTRLEANMFAYIRTEHRLLGFDIGDWSILLAGVALVASLTLLV